MTTQITPTRPDGQSPEPRPSGGLNRGATMTELRAMLRQVTNPATCDTHAYRWVDGALVGFDESRIRSLIGGAR